MLDFLEQGSIVSIEVLDIDLDPVPPQDPTRNRTHNIAYTNTNMPLHQYSESLSLLLLALDAVETGGIDRIRNQRRILIQQIDDEVKCLEDRVCTIWESWLLDRDEVGNMFTIT
jgi:hypothetical protein